MRPCTPFCRSGTSCLCCSAAAGLHCTTWQHAGPCAQLLGPEAAAERRYDEYGRLKKNYREGGDDRRAREAAALARLQGVSLGFSVAAEGGCAAFLGTERSLGLCRVAHDAAAAAVPRTDSLQWHDAATVTLEGDCKSARPSA